VNARETKQEGGPSSCVS